jgi:hypothetical protein
VSQRKSDDAKAAATLIAALRRRLDNQHVRTDPAVIEELRKLEAQLVAQFVTVGAVPGRHRSGILPTLRGSGLQVEDADGYNLKPDPLTARTAAEFMEILRRYRAWSGDPSWRSMAMRSGQVRVHSTMHAAMHSDLLPRLDLVRAVIAGCGGSHDDIRAFVTAWRFIDSDCRASNSEE